MIEKKADYPLQDFYGDIYLTYDRVNRIFTFGRDRSWREKAAIACLESKPRRVLDLCTGTGDFILQVARLCEEDVSLTGYDFSHSMLEEARMKSEIVRQEHQIPGIKFLEGEVKNMPFKDGQFDVIGITFGIRNLVYENSLAQQHLAEIYRVLKPGGRLVILESSRPANPIWRIFNTIYLRLILPYLGGVFSGNLKAYRYLALSSRNYYSIPEMGSILQKTNFILLEGKPLFLGSVMLVVAQKNE